MVVDSNDSAMPDKHAVFEPIYDEYGLLHLALAVRLG